MPRLNLVALVCMISKTNTHTQTKTLNSVPVVEDGAKRKGVVL